ncbi:S1 family peptidase [Nocardia asteroides]|uniref:S1 family peptidase n=1 Tax=Nocardia asteroides TaxID=1824 RepID=UPI001E4D64B9|nr:S1 family peptidase [Nocardia asteroides]UGT61437.1 S1 family peptidase [Nocardia asteroides]
MNRSLARAVTAGAALALVPLGAGAAAAEDAPVPLGGGSGIVVDNTAQCTVTTIGYDAAGRLVGLTAGHCGGAGATVVAERDHDLGVVGRFVHSDPDLDYAVIQFDPARVAPVNRVGNATITGIGAPAQFPAVVCKKGRTSGETCGVAWGDVLNTAQETWTQLCVLEGDSGAPVMVGSTLVGMVNAYLGLGCLGPEVGTTMAAIVNDLNARGSVGAGFHPL